MRGAPAGRASEAISTRTTRRLSVCLSPRFSRTLRTRRFVQKRGVAAFRALIDEADCAITWRARELCSGFLPGSAARCPRHVSEPASADKPPTLRRSQSVREESRTDKATDNMAQKPTQKQYDAQIASSRAIMGIDSPSDRRRDGLRRRIGS